MMSQGLGSVVGVKGTSVVNNRGVSLSIKMDPIADPGASQMLGQMTGTIEYLLVPFPEEPVGVGARWEVRAAMNANGISLFQRTEYELTALQGSTVTITSKTEQTAPPQNVSPPGLPAEMQMSLEGLKHTGTGTGSIQLNTLVPSGTSESTTATSMGVNAGGQVMSMTVEVKTKLTIAPGK
jgi:hypothetical protein